MSDIVVHPSTQRQLDMFAKSPSHAIMLSGPAGSGKMTLAVRLAESILNLPEGGLASYSYSQVVKPIEGKAIGIEPIRSLEHFLSLKVPSKNEHNRVVIVEDSHLLTQEAQNALLKNLEEPPAGTVIILTASHDKSLLPTIRSRAQSIIVQKPSKGELEKHFTAQGFASQDISKSHAVSGGLAGLMYALLDDAEHPLLEATEQARQLLSQTPYERLLSVEALSKRRELAADTVDILQQMAHVSLQTATGKAAKRWRAVQSSSYEAAEALRKNAQPKLVLDNLVLQF